jgi:hypothetical protein
MMWWSSSHSSSVLSEPCGKVSHHTAHQLDLMREPYNYSNRPGKGGQVSLSFYSSSLRHLPCLFRPLLPFPNPQMSPPPAARHCMGIDMACRPARLPGMISDSLPKRRKGWIKKRGVLRALCPTHLSSSRGSPVPPA